MEAVEDGDRAGEGSSESKRWSSPTIPLSMRSRDGEGGNTSTIDGGVDGSGEPAYDTLQEEEGDDVEKEEVVEAVEAVDELRLCRLERVDLAGGRNREADGLKGGELHEPGTAGSQSSAQRGDGKGEDDVEGADEEVEDEVDVCESEGDSRAYSSDNVAACVIPVS